MARKKPRRMRRRRDVKLHPRVEFLEARAMLANDVFIGGAGSTWSNGLVWSTGAPPGAGDTAILDANQRASVGFGSLVLPPPAAGVAAPATTTVGGLTVVGTNYVDLNGQRLVAGFIGGAGITVGSTTSNDTSASLGLSGGRVVARQAIVGVSAGQLAMLSLSSARAVVNGSLILAQGANAARAVNDPPADAMLTLADSYLDAGSTAVATGSESVASVEIDSTDPANYTSVFYAGSGLTVAGGGFSLGTVTVNSGSDMVSGTANIANGAQAQGTVNVQGGGSVWSVRSGSPTGPLSFVQANYANGALTVPAGVNLTTLNVGAGASSEGKLNITGGSQVEAGNLFIAPASGSTGTVNVSGSSSGSDGGNPAPSRLLVPGSITVGMGGNGTLSLTSGAIASSKTGVIGSDTSATTSTVTVNTGAKWFITSSSPRAMQIGGQAKGTIDIGTGSSVIVNGGVDDRSGGSVKGAGDIQALNGNANNAAPDGTFLTESGALIDPGDDADPYGTLTIDGDLDDALGGTLDIILGAPGNNSSLAISGSANLGTADSLQITDSGTASYVAGDSFTVLRAGGLSGQFANLPTAPGSTTATFAGGTAGLPTLPGSEAWQVSYANDNVTLTVVNVPTAAVGASILNGQWNSTVSVQVNLSSAPTTAVSVPYVISGLPSNAADASVVPGVVQFGPGDTTATIPIQLGQASDDQAISGTSFTVTLGGPGQLLGATIDTNNATTVVEVAGSNGSGSGSGPGSGTIADDGWRTSTNTDTITSINISSQVGVDFNILGAFTDDPNLDNNDAWYTASIVGNVALLNNVPGIDVDVAFSGAGCSELGYPTWSGTFCSFTAPFDPSTGEYDWSQAVLSGPLGDISAGSSSVTSTIGSGGYEAFPIDCAVTLSIQGSASVSGSGSVETYFNKYLGPMPGQTGSGPGTGGDDGPPPPTISVYASPDEIDEAGQEESMLVFTLVGGNSQPYNTTFNLDDYDATFNPDDEAAIGSDYQLLNAAGNPANDYLTLNFPAGASPVDVTVQALDDSADDPNPDDPAQTLWALAA